MRPLEAGLPDRPVGEPEELVTAVWDKPKMANPISASTGKLLFICVSLVRFNIHTEMTTNWLLFGCLW